MPSEAKTYKSAVDLWVLAIMIGVPFATILTGASIAFGLYFFHWHENVGRVAGAFLVLIGAGTSALIAIFAFPCCYTLRETELFIRCGAYKLVLPYNKIQRLELSCSLWNSPALSVNRVKIVHEGGFCLVSPKNRSEFIRDLQERLTASSARA
jgi:hypothetical protein